MKKSAKLVFFGTDDFAVPSLRALLDDGWQVSAVVTKPDTRAGRGLQLKVSGIKKITQKHSIKKIFQPDNLAEIEHEIAALKPKLGILVAYGKLIPEKFIDLFPGGIINVHPSLLPVWRGPSPIEAAILSGDKQTGISLMRLTASMDTGPVYTQTVVTLGGSEDRLGLAHGLAEKGARFLVEKLPEIINGSIKPIPQDNSKSSYSQLLKKEDSWLDTDRPAEVLERQVRAYLGFPKSRIKLFTKHEVVITKAQVANPPAGGENDGRLIIKCNPGWLEILELIAPSGRTTSGRDFLRGYQE